MIDLVVLASSMKVYVYFAKSMIRQFYGFDHSDIIMFSELTPKNDMVDKLQLVHHLQVK